MAVIEGSVLTGWAHACIILTSAVLFTVHVTVTEDTTGSDGETMTRSTTKPPPSLVIEGALPAWPRGETKHEINE